MTPKMILTFICFVIAVLASWRLSRRGEYHIARDMTFLAITIIAGAAWAILTIQLAMEWHMAYLGSAIQHAQDARAALEAMIAKGQCICP